MASSKNNKKENNLVTLKWVIKVSKRYIPGVVLQTIISVLTAAASIYLALVSKDVIDIATKSKDGSLKTSAIILFSLVIFQIFGSIAHSYLSTYLRTKTKMNFRNRLFKVINRRKYSGISNYHSGDFVNRLSSDVETVDAAFESIVPHIASMLTKIIGGIWAIIVLEPKIAILILSFGLFIPAFGRIISKRFKKVYKSCQESEGHIRSFMQECFENLVVVKVFSGEKSFSKKLDSYMQNNYKLVMKRTTLHIISHTLLQAIFTLGYYVVLLWGASSISGGAITYGTLMAFLQLFNQLRAPLQGVSGIMPQYYSMLASAERLMEIENGDYDLKENKKKTDELKAKFKSIEFSGVDFSYGDEDILKNCTFDAQRGKITAITGESGSGKSTVLKLLLGLYEPQNGKITINNSVPLDTSIRCIFTYVPQGNLVLSGTIRENITLCDDTISENKIIKACKAACIYDIIEDLPEGLDTVLTERGGGLSEGQLQRISIARALLTDAPVILLDEATSALDEQTETALLENIKAMSDKTILFVTHRNTSLKACDKIIHVENKVFVTIKE